ncbi:MAG: peptidoglycan-binding protein [Cyanobacteria bacterium P01_E01_bin.6]
MKTSALRSIFSRGKQSLELRLPKQHSSNITGRTSRLVWRFVTLVCVFPVITGGVVLIGHHTVSAQILTDSITSLRFGSQGPAVTALQEALRSQGFSIGVDGVFGSGTEDALRRFQENRGLTVDGIYGRSTEIALFGSGVTPGSPVSGTPGQADFLNTPAGSRTVRLGDRGSDVLQLQQLLNTVGVNAGIPDGNFGLTTLAAVERFQRDRGLTVDGVVGSSTWSALGIGSSPTPTQPVITPVPTTPLPSVPPTFPPSVVSPPVVSSGVVVTPLDTILAQGRYVVVVPGSNTRNITTIESELGRRAFLTRSGRGSFTTPGGYGSYSAAQDDALRLRGANLDARVERF